jgi:Flp pilus assembly protein TadG
MFTREQESESKVVAPPGGRRAARRDAGMRHERGSFGVMFAGTLIVMLGVCAAAIDMGQIYNRQAELNGMAKAVALAAASQLDGSKEGVEAALTRAAAVARSYRYAYRQSYVWADAAIQFSKFPARDGDWVSAEAAKSQPAGMYYVEVDTSRLADGSNTGPTFMLGILSPTTTAFNLRDRAVAGRSNLKVTPLAVCAMSALPAAPRSNPGPPAVVELVEFGFRRGISYDLMALNPNGTTAESFVVDPFALPWKTGTGTNTSISKVGPFVCSGKIWAPSVKGGSIHVSRPFPIASLYKHLNSRFDDFTSGDCNANGAPPDYNIKQYSMTTIGWMTRPTGQSAAPYTDNARAETYADPLPVPAGGTTDSYGVLWSYAKPVPFANYVAGSPEPKNGYATFTTANWVSLYSPKPVVSSYPSGQDEPYNAMAGANYGSPSSLRIAIAQVGRRVLNIPLLSCPVAAGADTTATVLGIGRFFMTVPATSTTLHAEFAGAVAESALLGQAELYP